MTGNEQRDGSNGGGHRPFSEIGPLAPPRAVALIRRAAVELDRYHARNGAHGALTPAVLTVSSDDTVTVLPPAAALADDDAETRRYWSPQRRAGEPPRPSDDLYSLGAIARELLASDDSASQHPDDSEGRLLAQAQRVLGTLTSWSPAERPANGTELAQALDRFVAAPAGLPATLAGHSALDRRHLPEPAWAVASRVAQARRAHRLAQSAPPRPVRPVRVRQVRAPLGKGHYPDMPLPTGWVAVLVAILCSVYLLPIYFMLFPSG